MGHQIQTFIFNSEISKEEIERKLNRYVNTAEGTNKGLHDKIHWVSNRICVDEDEAKNYINQLDKGGHQHIAVLFYTYPSETQDKELNDIRLQLQEAVKKYDELRNKLHYKDVKSNYISCRGCSSKLNRIYITTNNCPLCGIDLRPKSTLDKIKALADRVKKLDIKYRECEIAVEKKKANKTQIKWLVKIEY